MVPVVIHARRLFNTDKVHLPPVPQFVHVALPVGPRDLHRVPLFPIRAVVLHRVNFSNFATATYVYWRNGNNYDIFK